LAKNYGTHNLSVFALCSLQMYLGWFNVQLSSMQMKNIFPYFSHQT